MSYSDYKKVFKQLKAKPIKLKKFIKHNSPIARKFGISVTKCRRCGSVKGHIGKYGLNLCRQCFREIATKLGFKKYN
ncbi:30S ribosomal protein S14 [Candidatus Woesearchaeota archaeon]|nr:30S ribosomal protein S14 [Candidatus Woesearchaeota archaeon]